MRRALSVLTLLLIARAQAETIERTPVADARPLMRAAIASSAGEAHGVLVGELADAITRRFAASSPLYIDVAITRRYAQPGCARLKVVFWQEGVHQPRAVQATKQTFEIGINYCLDGLPPRSLR